MKGKGNADFYAKLLAKEMGATKQDMMAIEEVAQALDKAGSRNSVDRAKLSDAGQKVYDGLKNSPDTKASLILATAEGYTHRLGDMNNNISEVNKAADAIFNNGLAAEKRVTYLQQPYIDALKNAIKKTYGQPDIAQSAAMRDKENRQVSTRVAMQKLYEERVAANKADQAKHSLVGKNAVKPNLGTI
jgi:hypothetical protein